MFLIWFSERHRVKNVILDRRYTFKLEGMLAECQNDWKTCYAVLPTISHLMDFGFIYYIMHVEPCSL